MRKLALSLIMMFALSTVFVGCRETNKASDDMEEVGEDIEDAADDVGDEIEDAVDD